MDIEKFLEEVKELKNERELLANRVVELEMENKTIKTESKQLAKALQDNVNETEKLKKDVSNLQDAITIAIDTLSLKPEVVK